MPDISDADAVERAREALGLDATVSGRAWRVRRLDRPGDVYFLVLFGDEAAPVAAAAVGAVDGDVRNSAHLSGTTPHLLSEDQAVALADLAGAVRAELVWLPSRASRSPLYPLWEVTSGASRRYVDQSGNVTDALETGGRGG